MSEQAADATAAARTFHTCLLHAHKCMLLPPALLTLFVMNGCCDRLKSHVQVMTAFSKNEANLSGGKSVHTWASTVCLLLQILCQGIPNTMS